MRIKLALTLEITRKEPEKPSAPDVLEHNGSQTEILPQPRYVGYEQVGEEYKHAR